MTKYEVSTFDVCASGFERLRSYDEFILVASIEAETEAVDLVEQWKADLQSCMRDDDFDYEAAEQAIDDYYDAAVRPLFATRKNPFNLEPGRDDIGFDDEGCNAFLYIHVEGAHFPVY